MGSSGFKVSKLVINIKYQITGCLFLVLIRNQKSFNVPQMGKFVCHSSDSILQKQKHITRTETIAKISNKIKKGRNTHIYIFTWYGAKLTAVFFFFYCFAVKWCTFLNLLDSSALLILVFTHLFIVSTLLIKNLIVLIFCQSTKSHPCPMMQYWCRSIWSKISKYVILLPTLSIYEELMRGF